MDDLMHAVTTCDSLYLVLFTISTLYVTYIISYMFFTEKKYAFTKYNYHGHTWRSIQCSKAVPYNVLCSTCENLMLPLNGLFCEVCALSTCKSCLRHTNKSFSCRPPTSDADKPVPHHWIKVGTSREVLVDDDENFQGYYCTWCQRLKYFHGSPDPTKICDFGIYKDAIVPPNCVTLGKHETFTVRNLQKENWNPIFIFANKKSGSNKGDEILAMFRGLLNPIQVIDISTLAPEKIVKCLPSKCRLLVAGGDGTIAWVLNSLRDLKIEAPVGILPLGTGNDLSRSLGWGAGDDSEVDAHAILRGVYKAQPKLIDRWKMTIKRPPSRIGRFRADKTMFVYNYASIGVDAQVALDFHRARSQLLKKYTNRTINYFLYLIFGTQRVLDDACCKGLEKKVEIFIEDAEKSLELPPLQSIVLLNIPSWGAGVNLWDLGGANEAIGRQEMDDGKIEVVGISSSFQIARLQCGLAEPYCFDQAEKIKVNLNGKYAMQVDGEPWLQNPCTILMEFDSKAMVLEKGWDE